MKVIKIKTPAKINLTLEILNKRNDGYHNIQSIMHTVSLYDFLTIEIKYLKTEGNIIKLSGNSSLIPYDKTNLVYKAAVKFLNKAQIKNVEVCIYIEKNIPVSAGLAGGSTNGAGTIFGLNKLFDNILSDEEINELCASLGSDLNFCLKGGCAICTSRGEVIQSIPPYIHSVSILKPKNIGISAKEAYQSFSMLKDKSFPDNTTKLKNLIENNFFDEKLLYNSFEKALFDKYPKLKEIKINVKNSLMSGSGSSFFVLNNKITTSLNKNDYEIFENLTTIPNGVCVCE